MRTVQKPGIFQSVSAHSALLFFSPDVIVWMLYMGLLSQEDCHDSFKEDSGEEKQQDKILLDLQKKISSTAKERNLD